MVGIPARNAVVDTALRVPISTTRLPSARTALFAVFQLTSKPSATRATVRCWTTIPSSAHRRPRLDSLALGSAARLVSCRHT